MSPGEDPNGGGAFPVDEDEAEAAVGGVDARSEPVNQDYMTATLPEDYWIQLVYLARQHAGWAAIEGRTDVAERDMGIADELEAQIDYEGT